jgi:hypothetical protein
MRTKIVQILFLLGVVGALAGPVAAGEYQLILGQGEEVCEACLKNLQQQPAEEAVCDRQYAADLGLRAPEWKPLDLQEHTELYTRVAKLVTRGRETAKDKDFDDPASFKKFLETTMKINRASMEMVHVDIDNDGTREWMLRYRGGNCRREFHGFGSTYDSALLVMAEDRRTIDYGKTDSLIQHESRGPRYLIGIPMFQLYKIFTHKETVYFDKWDGGGGSKLPRADANTLSVYRVNKGQTSKVCQIRLYPPDAIPY